MISAPVWIASPPEVHSALLSSGPGPGPLLSAAGEWNGLSIEYASAADELTALLGAVQAGAWQGPSAEQYVAAHAPYLTWLVQASADSAGVAAQHEVAATAYASALATMPTMAELTANHLTHGVLIATNFFGINTIPIALNEADYVRMWIQAATTMSTYQAVSGAALASAPRTVEAPPVVKADTALPAEETPAGGIVDFFTRMFEQLGQLLANPIGVIQEILNTPGALVTWFPLLFFIAYEAFFIPVGFGTWGSLLGATVMVPIVLGVGLAYLADLFGGDWTMDPVATPAPGAAAASPDRPTVAMAGFGPGIATPGAASVPAAPPASAAAPPAPAPGAMGFGYLVGGSDPGTGLGPTLIDRTKARAPSARVPAAAAAVGASARERSRARRRRRAVLHDHADEFMDMNSGPAAESPADVASAAGSDRGTGPLGFTGTVEKRAGARASGLTTLAGDGFGSGPNMPMLPDTWGEKDLADSAGESESEPK